MAGVKELVNSKIAENKVMVFSKTWCPYCGTAKGILKKYVSQGVISTKDIGVMEIDRSHDCGIIQNYLKKMTGAKTVRA